MPRLGPIVIIEDDRDDLDLLQEILKELKVRNKLECFTTPLSAFTYLKNTTDNPFLIICDVNLPQKNGLDFKKQIDADKELRKKSIPFIFYSTSVNQRAVDDAFYHMAVQGFFKKGTSYQEMKELVRLILDYWQHCWHPSSY